jgi:hypothetical protein
MFKFWISLSLIGLGVAVGLGFLIFPSRQKDYTAYEALLASSHALQTHVNISSQQKRGEVSKRIWYQEETPLYICIKSPQSELFCVQHDHQIELIEKLQDVICIMQEELYYEGEGGQPMQKVRYMEAQNSSYSYKTNLFVAEEVKLWKVQLEGHDPPAVISLANPLMAATAKRVEFTLKGNALDFIAYHMRAKLSSEEQSI